MTHGPSRAVAAVLTRLRPSRKRPATAVDEPRKAPRHAAVPVPRQVVTVAPQAWSVLPGSPPVPTTLPVVELPLTEADLQVAEASLPATAVAEAIAVPDLPAARSPLEEAAAVLAATAPPPQPTDPAPYVLPQAREPHAASYEACLTILPR